MGVLEPSFYINHKSLTSRPNPTPISKRYSHSNISINLTKASLNSSIYARNRKLTNRQAPHSHNQI